MQASEHYRPRDILNTEMQEAECMVRNLGTVAMGVIGENTKKSFLDY